MKAKLMVSIRVLGLSLLLLPAACSQSRAATQQDVPTGPSSLSAPDSGAPYGESLHVLNVQQYEDRTPVSSESGRAPATTRWITVVQFEALDCGQTRDEDFTLRMTRKGSAALLRIESLKNRSGCTSGKRQTFQVASSQLKRGETVVITNPALIEELAPAE